MSDDDEQTSIYDPAQRRKKDTKRGHDAQPNRALKHEKEEFRKRAIEMATPTAIDRAPSEPIRVISMKTPEPADARQQEAKEHKVKLRAMAELDNGRVTPPRGYLAPPRDVKQARVRRMRDLVIWSCAVIVIGAVVMAGVWLLARG